MKTTRKTVQGILSRAIPVNMTYQKAEPAKVGKGRWSRKIERWQGATPDRLFAVMLYGSAMDVRRLEFMLPLTRGADVFARNMLAITKVVEGLYPGWTEEDNKWLQHAILKTDDQEERTREGVTVSRMDVYGQRIIFVNLR